MKLSTTFRTLAVLCTASIILKPTQSIPPNDVCCHLANDETGCEAYTEHDDLSFDNCVGGIGVDCDGVPYDLDFGVMGILSINLVKPVHAANGKVTIKTSVGSILHDLCCIEHPQGAFCNGANYPIDETINLVGGADNDCACIMEWRKAAWNVLRGRYWLAEFDEAPHSSDLTKIPFSELSRESWLPTSWTTNYLEYKSNWGLQENEATSQLCAPTGTELDCPSEDDNCRIGTFRYTACSPDASGCTSTEYGNWNRKGRDHANAGDSDYCCSGEFMKVYRNSAGTTRYGTCK